MGLMKHPFIQKKREKRTPPKKFLFYFFLVLTAFVLSGSPAFGLRLTRVKHLFDITQNFNAPSDVSVSKNGQIYVVDGVNSKIKVFNRDGKYVFAFGSRGAANGQFDSPPVSDAWLTNTWLPGEIVADQRTIPIWPNANPGRYNLVIGLYTAHDLARLPVFVDGQPAGDQLILVEITLNGH